MSGALVLMPSFQPGIGPGGQCIPVNPYYISSRAREFDFHTSLIELAGDVNLRMTNYAMHRVHSFANRVGLTLNGAQQFGLQARVHFADLVQQQRAAIGLFELADAARDGAGEGALLMAEQFGFQ